MTHIIQRLLEMHYDNLRVRAHLRKKRFLVTRQEWDELDALERDGNIFLLRREDVLLFRDRPLEIAPDDAISSEARIKPIRVRKGKRVSTDARRDKVPSGGKPGVSRDRKEKVPGMAGGNKRKLEKEGRVYSAPTKGVDAPGTQKEEARAGEGMAPEEAENKA